MRIMWICRWPLWLKDLGVNRSYVVCMGAKAWAKGKRARMDQQQKQAKQISDAQAYPQVRGKKTFRLREERDILRKAAKYFA